MIRLIPPSHLGIRGLDPYGSGEYGASRDLGRRKHEGIDFVVEPGQLVTAPCDCECLRSGRVYSTGKNRYTSMHLRPTEAPEMLVKLFYVQPKDTVHGEIYDAGDPIGTAEDLTLRYGVDRTHSGPITCHVHLEVWQMLEQSNGKRRMTRIDPTPFFEEDGWDAAS